MTTTTSFESLIVYIIAVGGQPRNILLPLQAKAALPGSEVVVIDAITPSNIPPSELLNLIEDSSALLGRRIGEREIAVMLSHRKCYASFQNSGKKYLLVLEDDVLINSSNIEKLDILNILETRKATVVTLYSPKWSIWKKTNLGLEAKIPPAYAAAYFINKECTQLALSHKALGLADWPPWSMKTNFFYRNYFAISCLQNESFLEKGRLYDKKFKLKYALFKSLHGEIKRSWQVRFIVIYPLKWKLYKLMRIFLSLRSSNERIESWF